MNSLTFLLRKPFVLIITVIVCFAIIILFSGVLTSKPSVLITPTLATSSISLNQNTTLTVTIENRDTKMHSIEYRIVGTFSNNSLQFYFKNGTTLPSPVFNSSTLFYTVIYPDKRIMNTGEKIDIAVYVKGLDPGAAKYTYTLFLEAWADKAFSERRSIQLTVIRP
ncbi:hypothetical protein MUP77_07120 [Candidatus Bathyarchaeota archaeon]|nr:hypothetical protein [Candidatus Bathyarchaeota archaeon]